MLNRDFRFRADDLACVALLFGDDDDPVLIVFLPLKSRCHCRVKAASQSARHDNRRDKNHADRQFTQRRAGSRGIR